MKFPQLILLLILQLCISGLVVAQDNFESWQKEFPNGAWYQTFNAEIYSEKSQDSIKSFILESLKVDGISSKRIADLKLAYATFKRGNDSREIISKYLGEALDTYITANDQDGEARVIIQQAKITPRSIPIDSVINQLDRSLQLSLDNEDYVSALSTQTLLATRLRQVSKLAAADSVVNAGKNFYSKVSDTNLSIPLHSLEGARISSMIGKSSQGTILAKKAFYFFKKAKFSGAAGGSAQNLAIIYYRQQKIDSALYWLNLAAETMPDSWGKESIGIQAVRTSILASTRDYEKAAELATKYYPLSLEATDTANAITFLQTLGIINYKKDPKQLDSAIHYFQLGVDLSRNIGQRSMEATMRNSLAIALAKGEQYTDAIAQFEAAMKIRGNNDITNPSELAGLISSYSYLKKTDEAINYVAKLEALPIDRYSPPTKKNIFDALQFYYASVGNLQKSTFYKDSLIRYTEITNNARLDEKIQKMNAEYKVKEEKAEKLILSERLKAEEIISKKQRLGLFLAGIIGLLLISGLFFIRRESQRRALLNSELSLKNKEVTLQKEQISQLNQDLNHRTSNYLGSIRFLLERQRDSAEEAGLDVTVVNSLDRQILAFTKVQDKLKETLDDVNLKEYLEDFCEAVGEALAAQGRPVQFNVNVADVDVKPSFAAPLALIINELATNSMKYARREDGLLRIALDAVEVNGGELRVFYRDGGAQEGEINQEVFSSGQGVETVLGFTDQLKGRLIRYGAESYDYEAVFGLEG